MWTMVAAMETDPYESMADLARELHEIKAEETKLATRKAIVQAAMREIAKILAGGEDDEPESGDEPGGGFMTIAGSSPPGFRPLGSRDKQLLRLLRDNPGANYGFFATDMYEEDTQSTRANIAAKFSHLKKNGYVVAKGPGDFALTEKGMAAIER